MWSSLGGHYSAYHSGQFWGHLWISGPPGTAGIVPPTSTMEERSGEPRSNYGAVGEGPKRPYHQFLCGGGP